MSRMRDSQIMFRVYDKEVGEMVDSQMHVFGESFAFGRVESWIKNHREAKGDKTILERFNDMVLVQYTGLRDATEWEELTGEEKDKWYNREEDWEGRFVYEGDIMEWNGKKSLIVFKGGETNDLTGWSQFMGFVPELIYDGTIKSFQMSKAKVIGNKFENPELLDK